MSTTTRLEALNEALDKVVRMGDFATCADPRGYIKADNRLLDACIDAGMSASVADHLGWAAERVAAWLLSGVEA